MTLKAQESRYFFGERVDGSFLLKEQADEMLSKTVSNIGQLGDPRSSLVRLCLCISLSIWLAFWAIDSLGQATINCPSYNYTLSNQDAVDALGAELCNRVQGSLTIEESSSGGITTLDPLGDLIEIGASLTVRTNSTLRFIDGLANVTNVGGSVVVTGNPQLQDILGLTNLASITGSLIIYGNDSLSNLDGLALLAEVGGGVTISGNKALAQIDGLAGINEVNGNLQISQNPSLANIDGLVNVGAVDGTLTISQNAGIRNLDGLGALTSAQNITLTQNDKLDDLTGLDNLSVVNGLFAIGQNATLRYVAPLARLATLGELSIYENSALQYVSGINNVTSLPSGLRISNNPSLVGVSGLTKLESASFINIYSNDRLAYLDGMRKLESVGSGEGSLYIVGNGALGRCEALVRVLGWGSNPMNVGSVSIYSNAEGCNSQYQVLASVQGPTQPSVTGSQVSGRQFFLTTVPSENRDQLYPITGYELSCDGAIETLSDDVSAPLLDNVSVSRSLRARSTQALGAIAVDVDITHSDMTDVVFSITSPAGTTVQLWNKSAGDADGLQGAFIEGSFPIEAEEEVNGCSTEVNNCTLTAFSPGNGSAAGVYEVQFDTDAQSWTYGGNVASTAGIYRRFGATRLGEDFYVLGNPFGNTSPRGLYKYSSLNSGASTVTSSLRSVTGNFYPNAITSDGTNLYVWFKSGEINRVNPSSGETTAFTTLTQVGGAVALTYDWDAHRLIASMGATWDDEVGQIYGISIDTLSWRKLANTGVNSGAIAYVGNQNAVMAGRNNGRARLIDLSSGVIEKTLTNGSYTNYTYVGGDGDTDLMALVNEGNSSNPIEVGLPSAESLSAITGEPMAGDWQFTIEDVSEGPIVREGILNSWGLRLKEVISNKALPFANPVPVSDLTRGQSYACSLSPVTALGASARSETFTVNYPYVVPSAPVILNTDYEEGLITLTVSVGDDGGNAIRNYEASCTGGGTTVTAQSSSPEITVAGLQDDVAYVCHVVATNGVGASGASASTEPIVPEALATGLPIWLLYQATQ